MKILSKFLFAIFVVALAFNKASAQGYSLSQIPNYGSGTTVSAVNNYGVVSGFYYDQSGGGHSFIDTSGNIQNIGTLGGSNTFIFTLSDAGQAAGFSQDPYQGYHAIIYDNGVIKDLGLKVTNINGWMNSNALGQIVINTGGLSYLYGGNTIIPIRPQSFNNASFNYAAYSLTNNGQMLVGGYNANTYQPYYYTYNNGTFTDTSTLCKATCYPQSINSSGQFVGYLYVNGGSYQHAFLYADGVIKDLVPQLRNSSANLINDKGQVIGTYNSVDGSKTHGFMYENNQFIDLGTLGGSNSTPSGLNSSGQIVGSSQVWDSVFNTNGEYHAFVYQNGKMFDLNSLVNPQGPLGLYVTLTSAQTITDSGYILAQGVDMRDFSNNYYLLAPPPVPVPASLWLLVSSIGGLGVFARKRKA